MHIILKLLVRAFGSDPKASADSRSTRLPIAAQFYSACISCAYYIYKILNSYPNYKPLVIEDTDMFLAGKRLHSTMGLWIM